MRKIFILVTMLIMTVSLIVYAQYGGDPSRSYIDQMMRDRINLRRAAATRRSASQHKSKPKSSKTRSSRSSKKSTTLSPQQTLSYPKVPQIKGLSYDVARKKLIAAGWQPSLHSRSYEQSPNIQGGNGLIFWKRGYHEIFESSGTGQAFCRFLFKDERGSILTVVTAGEEDPGGTYKSIVNNYALKASRKK